MGNTATSQEPPCASGQHTNSICICMSGLGSEPDSHDVRGTDFALPTYNSDTVEFQHSAEEIDEVEIPPKAGPKAETAQAVSCISEAQSESLTERKEENDHGFSDKVANSVGTDSLQRADSSNDTSILANLNGALVQVDFKNESLRRQWNTEAFQKNIQDGSRFLCFATIIFFIARIFVFTRRILMPCNVWPTALSHIGLLISVGIELAFWIAVIVNFFLCSRWPSAIAYGCTLFTVSCFFSLCMALPHEPKCGDRIRLNHCLANLSSTAYVLHEEYLDCVQGVTAMSIHIGFMYILPYAMPRAKHMSVMLVYISAYYIYVLWYQLDTRGDHFTWVDTVIGFVILSGASGVAVQSKLSIDSLAKKTYFLDHYTLKATNQLLAIMRFMVPHHVLLPMLENRGAVIAHRIECASVLFIIICDFDKAAHSLSPPELLRFLNDVFTKFDAIFDAHRVTKIETVGEEYVAAVGVLPNEVESRKLFGHQDALGRLISAAGAIFELQRDGTQFQMGLHTGPLVAGVIGKKLPRFRLFGDTINTAARLMQKGLPGELQFGDATRTGLPTWVDVTCRGSIEMKGKGMVTTYLLKRESLSKEQTSTQTMPPNAGKLVENEQLKSATGSRTTDQSKTPTDSKSTEQSKTPSVSISTGQSSASKTSWFSRVKSMVSKASDQSMASKTSFWKATKISSLIRSRKRQESFTDSASRSVNSSSSWGKVRKVLSLKRIIFREEKEDWLAKFYLGTPQEASTGKWMRTHRMMALFALVTMVEATFGLCWGTFDEGHKLYSVPRPLVFAISRALLFCINAWCWTASKPSPRVSISRFVRKLEVGRLIRYCINFLACFVSYDALTPTGDLEKNYLLERPRWNVWPCMFNVAYIIMMTEIWLRTRYALIFVLLVFIFLSVTIYVLDLWCIAMDTTTLMAFVIEGILALRLARNREESSRAHFKAAHYVEFTMERTQGILDTLMPPLVVMELRGLPKRSVLPSHFFKQAFVVQSDLVGFTKLASQRTPEEVVEFIGELFGLFDELTDKYGVYKIETVGDAYIAGQADPPLTATIRPLDVLLFGAGMLGITQRWSQRRGVEVACRVGMHAGSCTGGIVGKQMQRYHLFGKLLVGVELLESTAPTGKVQLSRLCREAIYEQILEDGLKPEIVTFRERDEPFLQTSKGDVVHYDEVGGGPTYILELCSA